MTGSHARARARLAKLQVKVADRRGRVHGIAPAAVRHMMHRAVANGYISLDTLRKIERGEPTVMIGSYFEVATLLGVELWEADADAVERYKDRFRDRLALLPARVRPAADEAGGRDG